jgi:hypothetical protein
LDRGISSPLLPISKLGSLRVMGGQKSGKNKKTKMSVLLVSELAFLSCKIYKKSETQSQYILIKKKER